MGMSREEKINTLKAIIQECEEYQLQRKETLFEIIQDLEQESRKDSIETLTKYFLGLVEVLRLHGIIHYSDIALITGTHNLEVSDIIDEFDKYKAESEDKE